MPCHICRFTSDWQWQQWWNIPYLLTASPPGMFITHFSNFLSHVLRIWASKCLLSLCANAAWKFKTGFESILQPGSKKINFILSFFSRTCPTVPAPSLYIPGITFIYTTCMFQALLLGECKLIRKLYKTFYIMFIVYSVIQWIYIKYLICATY